MQARYIYIQSYQSPVGEMLLGSYEGSLCLGDWKYRRKRHSIDTRLQQRLGAQYVEAPSTVIDAAIAQLQEYFRGERTIFDFPLLMAGTPFQQLVWRRLLEIPYGATVSYSQLAADIGKERAVRAVASANGANAVSIIIPCHRVIGSNGDLAGYAGGLDAKKKLLQLECNGVILS